MKRCAVAIAVLVATLWQTGDTYGVDLEKLYKDSINKQEQAVVPTLMKSPLPSNSGQLFIPSFYSTEGGSKHFSSILQ